MQTTQNTANRHQKRLESAASEGDEGSVPASSQEKVTEASNLLEGLVQDEATLRWQSDQLDTKAKELENEGDVSAKDEAAQLRAQSSTMLGLAAEIGRTIAEMRSDPRKKIDPRKIEGLRASVRQAGVWADAEIDDATEAHSDVAAHKEVAKRVAENKADPVKPKTPSKLKEKKEKKEKTAQPCAKKQAESEENEPSRHPHRHDAPEEEEKRPFFVRAKEKTRQVAHRVKVTVKTVWHHTCETVEDVGEGVVNIFHRGVEAVKHATPVVLAVKLAKKTFHAVTHPVETAGRVWGKVKNLFGHDDDAEPAIAAKVTFADVAPVSVISTPWMLSSLVGGKLALLNLPKLESAHVESHPTKPEATPLVEMNQHPDAIAFMPFLAKS